MDISRADLVFEATTKVSPYLGISTGHVANIGVLIFKLSRALSQQRHNHNFNDSYRCDTSWINLCVGEAKVSQNKLKRY